MRLTNSLSYKLFILYFSRVFTGDQRPSMMARDQTRSSTLIDPAALQKPVAQRNSSYGALGKDQAGLSRHPSLTMKPLLNFDGEDNGLQPPSNNRLPSTRSVFGVDTLWQREMVKLKEIQAAEEAEKEAQRLREEEEENRKQKKKDKRKKKNKNAEPEPETQERPSRVSVEPPILPNIERATRRAPPKPSDSDISSESEDDEASIPPVQKEPSWHVGSSDEENAGPRRTTGTGPRYPAQRKTSKSSVPTHPIDSDSDEDLPLAATIHKAEARAAFKSADDSDEDQPLSQVLRSKPKQPSGGFLDVQNTFGKLSFDAQRPVDEDDDEPLGLRASRIVPHSTGKDEDEDDLPLAFHPEQQRRTQYQMLAQVQAQQQQMVLQAQMQSSMMMNASMMNPGMMSPGYFSSPMVNPMAMMSMQVPAPMPSPPPVQDEMKFGLVDRWRRDVVPEGRNA